MSEALLSDPVIGPYRARAPSRAAAPHPRHCLMGWRVLFPTEYAVAAAAAAAMSNGDMTSSPLGVRPPLPHCRH